jgi:hypothetical protein
MLSCNYLRWGAVLAVALVVAFVLLYPSDEKRVREAAEAIVAAANDSEAALGLALAEHASPEVTLSVSDLSEPLEGQAAILAAHSRARVMGRRLQFRMQQVEISVQGSSARLNADVVAVLRLGLREQREARRASANFEKSGGKFLLVSAEVGREQPEQMEARP